MTIMIVKIKNIIIPGPIDNAASLDGWERGGEKTRFGAGDECVGYFRFIYIFFFDTTAAASGIYMRCYRVAIAVVYI